ASVPDEIDVPVTVSLTAAVGAHAGSTAAVLSVSALGGVVVQNANKEDPSPTRLALPAALISTALPAGISWDRSKGGSDNNDAPSAEYSRECSPRQAVPATFELVLTDYPARRKLALLTQD